MKNLFSVNETLLSAGCDSQIREKMKSTEDDIYFA